MPIDWRRYPTNWTQISHQIKEAANWRCQYCGRQCYRPGEKPDNLTRSEWTIHSGEAIASSGNPCFSSEYFSK